MADVRVVRARANADGREPPEWEITVVRFPTRIIVPCPPAIADLPEDIREGLRAWLDGHG